MLMQLQIAHDAGVEPPAHQAKIGLKALGERGRRRRAAELRRWLQHQHALPAPGEVRRSRERVGRGAEYYRVIVTHDLVPCVCTDAGQKKRDTRHETREFGSLMSHVSCLMSRSR